MNNLRKFAAVAVIGLSTLVLAPAQAADAKSESKPDAKACDMMGTMKTMEDQMAAIMNEKDPAKRKELMEKHMADMHEHMQHMMGMMKGSTDNDMTARMKMMEERMDKMDNEMSGMMGKGMSAKPKEDKPAAKPKDGKAAEHDHQH